MKRKGGQKKKKCNDQQERSSPERTSAETDFHLMKSGLYNTFNGYDLQRESRGSLTW